MDLQCSEHEGWRAEGKKTIMQVCGASVRNSCEWRRRLDVARWRQRPFVLTRLFERLDTLIFGGTKRLSLSEYVIRISFIYLRVLTRNCRTILGTLRICGHSGAYTGLHRCHTLQTHSIVPMHRETTSVIPHLHLGSDENKLLNQSMPHKFISKISATSHLHQPLPSSKHYCTQITFH